MNRPRVPEHFPEMIADYRDLGYCDDDIARRLGITTDGLYKRFGRFKIAHGRRWRDIEDAHAEAVMTKAQVRGYSRAS